MAAGRSPERSEQAALPKATQTTAPLVLSSLIHSAVWKPKKTRNNSSVGVSDHLTKRLAPCSKVLRYGAKQFMILSRTSERWRRRQWFVVDEQLPGFGRLPSAICSAGLGIFLVSARIQ